MDFNMIFFFLIVVGLPVLARVGSGMFKNWLAHKEAMTQAITSETAEKAAQYAAHTERLEQRVRVLERIITDRGTAIAEEIEQLRDAPLN